MEPQASRTKKSERTFENVLQAATRLFTEKGYHSTTMRDIGQASGLRAGALYYYCRSKEELVLLFYDRLNREVIATFQQQSDASAPLPDAMSHFLRLKLQSLGPYRNLIRIVMKEAIDPESPLSPLSSASAGTLDLSSGVFRTLIERSRDTQEEDIEAFARGLWVAHMAILAFWLHDRTDEHQATQRAIDTLASVLRLSGMLNRFSAFKRLRRQLLTLTTSLFPTGAQTVD